MIRVAAYADIPRMTCLLQEGYERSRYRGRAKMDVVATKQLLMGALQRNDQRGPTACCAFVAVTKTEEIVGLLVGALDRVYHIGDKLTATDIFFYCSESAAKRDWLHLLRAFEAWAEDNPKVIEINVGVTNIVDDDVDRLAGVYERLGYTRSGTMLERIIQ